MYSYLCFFKFKGSNSMTPNELLSLKTRRFCLGRHEKYVQYLERKKEKGKKLKKKLRCKSTWQMIFPIEIRCQRNYFTCIFIELDNDFY